MKGIFHVHSHFSNDSNLKIEHIIDYAKQNNINVVAITDHNTIKGSLELAQSVDENIFSIIGAEYSTDKGHLLVLFLERGLEDILDKNKKGLYDFRQIIEEARKQGALIYFAHPHKISNEDIEQVDGIEVFNSRVLDIERNKNAYALAYEHQKAMIGGSDAHSKWELPHCTVTINCNENKIEAIKESLKNTLIIECKTANYYHSAYSQILKQKKLKCYSKKYVVKQYMKYVMSIFFYFKKLLNKKKYDYTLKYSEYSKGEEHADY